MNSNGAQFCTVAVHRFRRDDQPQPVAGLRSMSYLEIPPGVVAVAGHGVECQQVGSFNQKGADDT